MKKVWSDWSKYKIIVAVILVFFMLKFMLPFLLEDDANLYWYMGKLVSEGKVPYRDFRTGHPPLMHFFSGFLFKIFGASLMVGRLVPALSGVGILFLTYLTGEKVEKGLGNVAAIFLFLSPHFQTLTNSMLGASLNLLFLLASFYFLTGKRDVLAGVCFVVAGLARYSAFPFFLVILGYVIWKKKWRFFYGVGAMAPIILGILLIPNFFQHTVLNMFARNVLLSQKMVGFYLFLIVQKWVIGMGILGGFLVFREKVKGELLQLAVLVSVSIALVLFLNEIRYWYIYYSLPFFCILGAYFVSYVRGRVPRGAGWAIVGAIYLILFWSFIPVLDYHDSPIVEEVLGPALTPGMVVYDPSGTRGAYLAMKYGTRIPLELVDNNAIGLASGTVDTGDVVKSLEIAMPLYLIDFRGDERTTYWMQTEIRGFVEGGYKPVFEGVEKNTGNRIVIWERK